MAATPVGAQESQLRQEIRLPDCGAPGNCEMKTPTIASIDRRFGRPVIEGTYDAAFTSTLRIIFGGVTYELGSSSELTANGNKWRLDLSRLQPALNTGMYELIVEVIGFNKETKQIKIVITITEDDLRGDDGQGGDPNGSEESPPSPSDRPRPMAPDEISGYTSNQALIGVLILSGVFTYIYIVQKYLRTINPVQYGIIDGDDT